MDTKKILAIAAILVVLGAGYALARPTSDGFWNSMMGYGNGMMSGGTMGPGTGMMGSGMMGPGTNGGASGYRIYAGYDGKGLEANATPITIEKARGYVEQYLASTANSDLVITEIIEFDNNFYAGVKEKSTGVHAFELLVNKYTGAVFPEMGPNMMWNTKYGHMNWNTQVQTTVTEKQAVEYAQKFLDGELPGTKVAEADAFHGYYTLEVLKDGKIYGMLSVNGNTGAVWYHNWHGNFVEILEVD